MSAQASAAAHRYTTSQVAASSNGRAMVCKGCDLSLEDSVDGMVVTFGDTLWHVSCRCTKCHRHVEHEQTLLLLSDGTPICASCTYICAVCGQVIMDDAIVTGEDSYHAECFNCKSCGTRIEELIFAKRSKGIWCMTCHNERVARSRKHAEAKRNRALRKEKEKENAARSSIAPPVDPLDADLTSASNIGDTYAFADNNSPVRGVPESGSGHPLSSIASSHSSPNQSAPHSRATSNNTGLLDASRTGLGLSTLSREEPRSSSPALARSEYASTPSVATPTTAVFPSSPDSDLNGLTRLTAPKTDKAANRRSGFYGATSLPALDSTAFRQNSAAEGQLRSPVPLAIPESASGEALASESESQSSSQVLDTSSVSRSVSSVESPPSRSTKIPDLHNSRSFYDPDTLLFLDQITASNTSPGSQPLSRLGTSSSYPVDLIGEDDESHVEHLSPELAGGATFEDHSTGGRNAENDYHRRSVTPKSEAAIKLRESIRLSREASNGSGMNLDVNLVEMLLVELDSTRKEMQELQGKYVAFRRASRSAFEGFSMAREEYDKEVAARRELETQMEVLRQKFTEQALRLASVDKDQKRAEELNRQSRDLRSSVVATEKQLSQLRAEVELSTAQIAELASVDKPAESHDTTEVANVSERSLAARLEKIKDEHRAEIEALILRRDELVREVDELSSERDQVASETAALTIRNAGLLDDNADLTRQIEANRSAVSRATLSSPVLNGQQAQLSPSPTTLRSIFSGGSSSNSHQPAYRTNATSPLPSDSDAETTGRGSDTSAPPPVSTRKFKWGKSTKGDSHRAGLGSISQPLKAVHRGGSSMSTMSDQSSVSGLQTARAGSISTSTSANSGVSGASQQHLWQQTSILRPVRCEYCGDKMWGLNDVRCSQCGCYSHAKCVGNFSTPCTSSSSFSPGAGYHAPLATPPLEDVGPSAANGGVYIFGNDLTAQMAIEKRDVPLVVTKCVAAVEAHGMNYEGIYRKTGGMGQTKLITQCFERGADFDLEDLDRFNDMAAVTSCLKNYFRSLPDPLFTHELHERFVACAEMPDTEARLEAIEDALSALPVAHFNTARALVAHLHRVHLHSNENKMTPANLGVVFGPTLLRSSVASREFSDMGLKAKLVEVLIDKFPRLFSRPPTPAKPSSNA